MIVDLDALNGWLNGTPSWSYQTSSPGWRRRRSYGSRPTTPTPPCG